MPETHERPGLMSLRAWRNRVLVLAGIGIVYAALFYGISHIRMPELSGGDGRPMFTPIVSEVGEQRGGMTEATSRRPGDLAVAELEPLTPPPRHWNFPTIDLSPSEPGWAATVSEFTPVKEAVPDASEVQELPPPDPSAPKVMGRKHTLRMVQWFRPVYDATQCAALGEDSLLVLDLLIAPGGRPIDIKMAQSSGSPQLDKTALQAAGLWRFAPPVWKSQPVEVRARIALRFNC